VQSFANCCHPLKHQKKKVDLMGKCTVCVSLAPTSVRAFTNLIKTVFPPGDKNRINPSGPSAQNNLQRSNSMMNNDLSQFPPHQHPNNQQQSNESNMQFPSDTPNMPFGPNAQQQQQQKQMGNFNMDQKPGDVSFT
jgi:hypothetical protein